MASMIKCVRSATCPHVRSTFCMLRCNSGFSNTRHFGAHCSGCKSGSGKNRNVQDIPCILCPISGDTNNPSKPTIYESRKYGHNLSTDNVIPCFETLPDFPTGVFRSTTGEILGRGAGKCTYYQNPEYFSFHHMSFYDFNLSLRQYRKRCPNTGRKPN